MNKPDLVPVWDPLIRLFHWLLVASFAITWYTQEGQYELHIIAGYTVFGLASFRILWGFIGPTHALFSDFITGPRQLLAYIRLLFIRQTIRYVGHNPAGGLMILFFLLGLMTVTISGVALDGAENWSGPLAEMRLFRYQEAIHQIHRWSTNTLLTLIPLHLLGVVHASIAHRENLVWSMISGHKRP